MTKTTTQVLDGKNLVYNLKQLNKGLLNSSMIDELVCSDPYTHQIMDIDGKNINAIFVSIKHPKYDEPVLDIANCDLLVAPNQRKNGLYCETMAGGVFHVLNQSDQRNVLLQLYTEVVNCLLIYSTYRLFPDLTGEDVSNE